MSDEPRLPRGKAGVILAALTLTAPLTAGIWTGVNRNKEIELAHISKERETALAEKDQGFKIQMGALDRAIDPQRPAQDRRQVLRFLSAVTGDPKLKTWADSELKIIQDDLEQEKKRRAEGEATIVTLTHERDGLIARIAEKRHHHLSSPEIDAELKKIEAELNRKRGEIARMSPSTPTPPPSPSISSLINTYTTADCDTSLMALLATGCSPPLPAVPALALGDTLSWTGTFGLSCTCKKRDWLSTSSALQLPPSPPP